jgi:hypothetical protein
MTSTMMMDRTGMGVQGVSGVPTPGVGVGGVSPAGANWLMVPRCTYKFEKCQGGMKVTCVCDDPTSRSMLQNLCSALLGGMCSFTCTLNGMTVCCCNLTMGMCKCELTETGCCVTCTSGDSKCCEMIQSCCDCLCCMCNAGCTCCLMMNNTPVCCGYSDAHCAATSKTKR